MATSKIKKRFTGYGTGVDLRPYTSWGNRYVFPCDGIVHVQSSYIKDKYMLLKLFDADTNSVGWYGAASPYNTNQGTASSVTVPVFAGMMAVIETNDSAACNATFLPFK